MSKSGICLLIAPVPVHCFSLTSGILLSKENYRVAVEMLKERFGDVQSVVNCHYTELINITPVINNSKGLRQLYDQVEKHFRS